MGIFDKKFTNIFWDGEIPTANPDAVGDYYYATDAQTDHDYWQERISDILLSITLDSSVEFQIVFGGEVTDGGGGTVDIAECVCIGMDDNDDKRVIHIPALTGVSLPSGWNDNRQIWVIAKYDFKLGSSTRNHWSGPSYHYQLEDTYMGDSDGYASTGTDDLFVDADPNNPSETVVCMGSFQMTVGDVFTDLSTGERSITYQINENIISDNENNTSDITDESFVLTKDSSTDALAWTADIKKSPEYLLTEKTEHGFWGDISYKDGDEIEIRVKGISGITPFIGVILNNGKFLKLTSNYTLKYDTPGNSGMILDGITAKLTNEWQIIWGFEDSGGNLAFGFTWMPKTTLNGAASGTSITLAQVNSQDIGLLFPEDAEFVTWESITEFETPIYIHSTTTYDAAGELYVDSRTSTVITSSKALTDGDGSGDSIWQVSGFKPLAVDDGLIVDVIGARGYLDTGIRIWNNSGSDIEQFNVNGGWFYFVNPDSNTGSIYSTDGSTDQGVKLIYIPPDKELCNLSFRGIDAAYTQFSYNTYWSANVANDEHVWRCYSNSVTTQVNPSNVMAKHGLITLRIDASASRGAYAQGYKI